MLLKSIFIPQFSTRSNNRVDRVVARKTARKSVLCVSSDSSLYCLKNNEFPHKDHCQNIRNSPISVSSVSKHPELSFVRLQPCGEELPKGQIRPFGRFVAREAVLDEEYWTAAWLRAEAHWESVSYMRSVDMYKRKYAEQEFYDLKRRCTIHDGNSLKCICIVTVKKEDPNVRRTVLNSVVGTLDLSIRQFSQGESFQRELRKGIGILASHAVSESHRYAYISNLCVSKFARRHGIASNMLYLAAGIAAASGMKQLFVHVNADNCPAQELYKKNDFQIVEVGSSPLSNNQRLLMCLEFC